MNWALNHQVEVLGITHPARKDGSKFYLPVDCPVVVGQRLYHESVPRYIVSVKSAPHAVIVDTEPAP